MRKRVFGREFKLEAIKLAQGQALVTMGSRDASVIALELRRDSQRG